jgi:hypothetical protein
MLVFLILDLTSKEFAIKKLQRHLYDIRTCAESNPFWG